jgi:hypothetical protein
MGNPDVWQCIDALDYALQSDKSLNAVESELRATPPDQRAVKLDRMMHVVGQLCRIEIRFHDAGVLQDGQEYM